IPEHGNALGLGYDLLQKFEPLRAQLGGLIADPRDVSPRPGEACDQPDSHGVAGTDEYPRNSRGRFLDGQSGFSPEYHDQIDLLPDQLNGERRQPFAPGFGPAARIYDCPPIKIA